MQALQRARTGRMRPDANGGPDQPETVLDLLHSRAARYKSRDGITDAEAVTKALDDPMRDGSATMRERGRAAAERAAKGKPLPAVTYGARREAAMARVREAHRQIAAANRQSAQSRPQGQSM